MIAPASWPQLRRGLVAILRGISPEEARGVGEELANAGFEAIEVPLNSPQALSSIEALARHLPSVPLLGAGTVLSAEAVASVESAGGRLIVAPNIDPSVMAAASARGMVTMPGVLTPTEAFAALKAGASALKFFPAMLLGPQGLAALKAVMPENATLAAVGGVSEDDFAAYAKIGITVFGLGSSLYKPGITAKEVGARARRIIAAYDRIVSKDT